MYKINDREINSMNAEDVRSLIEGLYEEAQKRSNYEEFKVNKRETSKLLSKMLLLADKYKLEIMVRSHNLGEVIFVSNKL